MAEGKVRRGLLLKTALEILRDAGTKMHPSQVLEEIQHRVDLNSRELSKDKSGAPRFDRAVGFDTGYAATVGWVSKIGGWSITEAGIEALETYPEPDELQAEFNRLYREVDQRSPVHGPRTMTWPNWRTQPRALSPTFSPTATSGCPTHTGC